jgi:hypothetical protein
MSQDRLEIGKFRIPDDFEIVLLEDGSFEFMPHSSYGYRKLREMSEEEKRKIVEEYRNLIRR